MRFKICMILFILIFSACQESSTSYNKSSQKSLAIDSNPINSTGYTIKKIDNVGKINLQLHDNPKDIYLLFTNPNSTNKKIILNNHKNIEQNRQNKIEPLVEDEKHLTQHAPKYIMDFNHQAIKRGESLDKQERINYQKSDSLNSSQLFYLEKDCSISTQATARKILKNIETKYGTKSLSIWVSDDSFGENCSKSHCITENMIDELANSFLKDGDDNDIYDWVTNIFGEEWDETDNSSLIDNNREITILLTDIDNDDRSSGGVLGYFYAKDNYKKNIFSGSNERTMFYIDSVIFATHQDNQQWSIENYKQKKILSTLAHEFEHMIQFYQKNILYSNSGLKPWIDEMLAVTVEDIIATKLQTKGLRGVSYTRGDAGEKQNSNGRFPLFNKNINLSLPTWNNKREDYSKVGAFGSYLIRNYGGAKLLHDILHNRYTNEKAIVDAIHKSPNGYDKNFEMLMHDWGIAILLSSSTDLGVDSGYLYNLGDFLETKYGDSSYSMGSINFFNYRNQPNIVTEISSIEPNSNLYYKIGTELRGDINITIDKDPNIITTLILK
ncbi:Probable hemagglutinin-related transmembrane protein [hydrothermal vent metagenome]|uniref:Probable hemagglutinin-related transmembrane protein n=1 Tax=hydrothermal vent metagenome TaxID=652676 RepID=A0A1W1BHK5_9ZZZZ